MSEHLRNQVVALSGMVDQLANLVNQRYQSKIEEKKDVPIVMITNKCNEPTLKNDEKVDQIMLESSDVQDDVSLDIFHELPTFDGDRVKYANWRTKTVTAMNLLSDQSTTMKYHQALLIIRYKIIGQASNILDDSRFNFESIIEQLDTSYIEIENEPEPFCISEQEVQPINQPNDSSNEDLIQLKREESYISKHESNSQSEVLLSSQQTKNVERTERVDDRRLILNTGIFWIAKVFCDNELSFSCQVKSIQIILLFQANFMNFKTMDKSIEYCRIVKRKNRQNLYKYFRAKFIHYFSFLSIN